MKLRSFLTILIVFFSIAGLYYFFPESQLTNGVVIDKLELNKSSRELHAMAKGRIIKTYAVSLGGNPIGHKQFEGDEKTPEGIYFIRAKSHHPKYHKYLWISYPNSKDVRYAEKFGRSAGGEVLIHGLNKKYSFMGKFHRWYDWTKGCIAITNSEMDELFDAVKTGTTIEIKP